jgi:hypothetical protein
MPSVPLPDGQINQLYSVTLLTVAQLSEMKQLTGKSRSRLVREAVEAMWIEVTKKKENDDTVS